MVADHGIDFSRYLQSLCDDDKYRDWQEFYTPIDALDPQGIEPKKGRKRLDLGLMVQTIQPPQQGQGLDKEKTERLNVLEGLRKYATDHVLLKGRPGSGKSTALELLLWEEAGELSQIPVLVELRRYSTSVLDLIQNFLASHRLNLNIAEIENLLSAGRFLLLIDGLNELPNESARRDLDNFRHKYRRDTPMIFTTRDLGVDFGIEKKLEMLPLTEVQMQQFVRAYLSEMGEEMLRRLGGRLRELGQTPLFLWMLCNVFLETNTIPSNLGEIFQRFTKIYDNKIKEDAPVSKESRNRWSLLLQHLAFEMMQGKTPTEFRLNIPKLEAEEILTEFLAAKKFDKPRECAFSWLNDLLNHHLIQVDSNDNIEFRHQMLQEYYASEKLLQLLPQISDERLKRDYLNYLKWTEPLALMLALVENEAQALRVVRLALNVDLMLGARLAGEVKREFQEKTVGLVLDCELSKLIKIKFLGITKSEVAVNYLTNCLQDEPSDVVRMSAVDILASIANEAAVNTLSTLVDDEEYYISFQSVRTLIGVANEAAVNALISALKSECPNVRKRAALGLGEIGSEAAVNPLIYALDDEDEGVRFGAINALNKIGTKDAIDAIKSFSLFLYDLFNEVSSVCNLEKLESTNNETSGNILTSVSKNEDVEIEIKKIFWDMKYQSLIENFISLLNDKKIDARIAATKCLIKFCNRTAVDSLITALQNENSEVRWRVAEVLAQIGTEASPAINSLITALQDENSEVSWRVAEALGNIGNEVAVNPLISALQDENSKVSWRVAEALGNIGNKAAVNNLISALQDKDSLVCYQSASALGKIAESDIMTQIWKILLSEIYEAKDIIVKIQERYQFYNHEIFHSPPIVEDKPSDPILDNLEAIKRDIKNMSETPKVQMNFNAPITGSSVAGNVEGDSNSIGTQNNYLAAENIAEVEKLLQQLLEQIEQTKPTPIEAQLIVEQAVEKHPVLKDGQIIEQAIKRYLPLKVRLQRMVTAAGIETVKVLFAPAGIAIEAIRAWTLPE